MAQLVVENISKKFGIVEAVKNLSFNVEDKEFVVLIGPSGCGKSTTLNLIAGLEELTSGNLYIGGKRVNDLHPKDRDIAMVFQNYALYPHMNVYKNMAFGLNMRGYGKPEIDKRIHDAARILGIQDLLARKPKELSGGQRQRVAVGRAIVRKPAMFLFDEPLSNLDAKLRVQMREEISKLHSKLQSTIVYVTHDQIEAMTMATRIVLLKDGVCQQIGSPMDLYDRPVNKFVAGFIGTPPMNIINARIQSRDSALYVIAENFELQIPQVFAKTYKLLSNREILFGIRPENISDMDFSERTSKDSSFCRASLEVDNVETLGSHIQLALKCSGGKLIAIVDSRIRVKPHETFKLFFNMEKMHLFTKEHPHKRIEQIQA
jgi:multiple sugar transport system ATP-binding protein